MHSFHIFNILACLQFLLTTMLVILGLISLVSYSILKLIIFGTQNRDRQLWKLGTLPPGLITFWKRTFPLDRSWHVLGLGYNPSVSQREIERAAVIHYNGNMKPWLEIGIPKYRGYWANYVDYDNMYLRDCNINP